jgi:dCMP deaminase
MNWNSYFMQMATLVASKSKDRSTKVGCVIVGPNNEVRTTGYNGFCRGVNDDVEERHQRPEKYFWTEHAERNAVYNAARNGIPLDGCTAYITMIPCADCTRALIQSGIKKIIIKKNNEDSRWVENFERSCVMIEEVGIEKLFYEQEEQILPT